MRQKSFISSGTVVMKVRNAQLAIQHLVEEQFGVSREEVPHGVAMLFGIERARADAATAIRDVTDYMIEDGRLRLSGLMVYLP